MATFSKSLGYWLLVSWEDQLFRKVSEFSVELDTKLTKELESEGFARNITRAVQGLRKKIVVNYKISLRI